MLVPVQAGVVYETEEQKIAKIAERQREENKILGNESNHSINHDDE